MSTQADKCSGHDACAPRAFATSSRDCTVEGERVTRQGDAFIPHECPAHPPHPAVCSRGFGTVTVNGRPVAYVGAGVSCPSATVGTGRATVTVG
ncbi:MAG: PAAR domain-containing protein [Myxococcota bacterium]